MADPMERGYMPDSWSDFGHSDEPNSYVDVFAELDAWDWNAHGMDTAADALPDGGAYPTSFDQELDLTLRTREGVHSSVPSQPAYPTAAHQQQMLMSGIPAVPSWNENLAAPLAPQVNGHMAYAASGLVPSRQDSLLHQDVAQNTAMQDLVCDSTRENVVIPFNENCAALTNGFLTNSTVPITPNGPMPANSCQMSMQNGFLPPNTIQGLAHAHMSPISQEHAAAHDARWHAATRIRSSSLKSTTAKSQPPTAEESLPSLGLDSASKTPVQGASIPMHYFRINSPGYTPSHGVPGANYSQVGQLHGPSHLGSLPPHTIPTWQDIASVGSQFLNTGNAAATANNTLDSFNFAGPQLLANSVNSIAPANLSYQFSDFKDPPQDITQANCRPILDASAQPTFRAHDTPPHAEEHAKQTSQSSQAMVEADLLSTPIQSNAAANAFTTPGPVPACATRTFSGTPVLSGLVMQETNWGEHVLTPTMNREISSHSRSPSASPKKNTTPIAKSPAGGRSYHKSTPSREAIPIFDLNKVPSGPQLSVGQLVENAIGYAENVQKANKMLAQSPDPATPLQQQAREAFGLTTEVLKNRLRGLGERVSGPKRELIRRMLQAKVKHGDIQIDSTAEVVKAWSAMCTAIVTPSAPKTPSADALVGSDSPTPAPASIEKHTTKDTSAKKRGRPRGKVDAKPRMKTWSDPDASNAAQEQLLSEMGHPQADISNDMEDLKLAPHVTVRMRSPSSAKRYKLENPHLDDFDLPDDEMDAVIWIPRGEPIDFTVPLGARKVSVKIADKKEFSTQVNHKKTSKASKTRSPVSDDASQSPAASPPPPEPELTPGTKRKRSLRSSSDKNFKLPSDDNDDTEASQDAGRPSKKAKQTPPTKAARKNARVSGVQSAPAKTKSKTAEAATKRGPRNSVARELLGLQRGMWTLPPVSKSGQGMRKKTDRRSG